MENPITGQAMLFPDQTKSFAGGEWYINIATQNHPDGEIRGQILTPLPFRGEGSEQRQRPQGADRYACRVSPAHARVVSPHWREFAP
jgi:CHRD domain